MTLLGSTAEGQTFREDTLRAMHFTPSGTLKELPAASAQDRDVRLPEGPAVVLRSLFHDVIVTPTRMGTAA
ncbi:MAG: hypothetical protein AAGE52_03760 [Myxococcota bacterium]